VNNTPKPPPAGRPGRPATVARWSLELLGSALVTADGFDAVEFDNVDGWQDNTGLTLTADKAVFQVEYKLSTGKFCPSSNAADQNAILKTFDLFDLPWTPAAESGLLLEQPQARRSLMSSAREEMPSLVKIWRRW
jgi:hypothetical protein